MSDEINNIKEQRCSTSTKVIKKKDIKLIKEFTSSLFCKRSRFLYYKDNKWNFLSNLSKKDKNKKKDEEPLSLTVDKTILHSVTFKENNFTDLMFKYFPELIKEDYLIIVATLNKFINDTEKLFKAKTTEIAIEWKEKTIGDYLLYVPVLNSIVESLEKPKDNKVQTNKKTLVLSTLIKSEVSFYEIDFTLCEGYNYNTIKLPFIEGLNTVASSYAKKQIDHICDIIITLSGSILYYEFYYEDSLVQVRSVQPLYFLLI